MSIPGRLRLAAPPMRNRRKDQRVRVTQVDMEAIFRTVLDGSKTGNPQVQMHSGSPADGNMNKRQFLSLFFFLENTRKASLPLDFRTVFF